MVASLSGIFQGLKVDGSDREFLREMLPAVDHRIRRCGGA